MSAGDIEPVRHLVCSSTAPSAEAVRFDPAWRTSTVLAIAAGIRERGNFDAMPILADALQDAGCDNQRLLDHCRHATQHNPLCWALPPILTEPPPSPPEPSVIVAAVREIFDASSPEESERRVMAVVLLGLFGLWVFGSLYLFLRQSPTFEVVKIPLLLFLTLLVPPLSLFLFTCWKVRRGRRDSVSGHPSQSVFLEAAQMLFRDSRQTLGSFPTACVFFPTSFLGIVAFFFAALLDDNAWCCALPLIPGVPYCVFYLVLCRNLVRSRWRRHNPQPPH